MLTNILAGIEICLVLGGIAFLALTIRQIRANARAESRFLQDMLDQMRESNLQIMKALKGDSYAGSFGDMDVHTDASVPADRTFMLNTTDLTQVLGNKRY